MSPSNEINLYVYLQMIRKYVLFIVVCVALGTFLGTVYNNMNYVPMYQASAKLYVNSSNDAPAPQSQVIGSNVIDFNSYSIDTYIEVIRSPIIMDKVVERYPNLDLSSERLISIVNAYSSNSEEVMVISARHTSYDKAVQIVNAVSTVFQTEIPKMTNVSKVVTLTKALEQNNPFPINDKSNTYTILGFLLALILSIGIVIMKEALDDTLKTEADIKEVFNCEVLTEVPKLSKREKGIALRKTKERGDATYVPAKN